MRQLASGLRFRGAGTTTLARQVVKEQYQRRRSGARRLSRSIASVQSRFKLLHLPVAHGYAVPGL
jgi:hypothetical protein